MVSSITITASCIAYQVVNGRDKVICINKLEANEVQKKVSLGLVQLLASG
jgi:hypothetical protein